MRKDKIKFFLMIGAIALLVMPISASAQWGHGPGGGPPEPGMREHFEKNLDNLRLLKLLETLELDEEHNNLFIAAFSTFRNKMRDISEVIDSHLDTLSTLIQSDKPDNQAILARVEIVDRLRNEKMSEIRKFHEDVIKMLNPVQIGKLVIFEERFEQEMLKSIRGFRKQKGF